MRKPAVFLDRDGTINEQMGYINHLRRFVLFPYAGEAIGLLNNHGYLVIVVSNQSGVARGYFPEELVHDVHRRMEMLLEEQGAVVDGIFFCPHHPRGSVEAYVEDCECRKPATGLIERACQDFDIDLSGSYAVGDRYLDIEMAHRAGIKGILVQTGYGLGEMAYVLPQQDIQAAYTAENLLDAARFIVGQGAGGGTTRL